MINNLRSLIFIDPNAKDNKPKKKTFPKSSEVEHTPVPVATTVTPSADVCQSDIDRVVQIYEDGFNKLNKPGYDFFEFFSAVLATGSQSPDIYKMAFSMAKAQAPNVSIDSLLTDAQDYISKLMEVHANNSSAGNNSKSNIEQEKETERSSLSTRVDSINNQISSLQVQLATANQALANIDSKYSTRLTEINCKLMANDHAKTKILNQINTVINGIKNNI